MAPVSKILTHPDKDLIVRWITVDGVSVREIESRLAQMYPKKNQQHLRVSFSTIQAFKKNHLNIEGKVLQDIKEANKLTRQWAAKKEAEEKLQNITAYQEAIKKAAEDEVDTRSEILKVFSIIEKRMEVLFNKINENEYIDKDAEKLLQDWIKQFQNVIDQHKKYEEGYREQVDVNVNVNVMSEQIQIMREAVRETLAEVDPSLTLIFMDKLSNKMRQLTVGHTPQVEKHSYLLNSALGQAEEVEVE